MGSKTEKFGFIKPSGEDYYDIENFNTNFDIIDENLHETNEKIASIDDQLQSGKERVTIVENQLQHESDRTTILEENLYNPNLLINSNFKVSELINQRNKSEYNSAGYCFDMWKFARSLTDGYIDLTGENMKWLFSERGNTGYFNLYQWFENYKEFEGKTITLSIKVRSLTGSGIFRSVINPGADFSDLYSAWFIEDDEWKVLQRTVTLPETIDEYFYVNIYLNDNNSDWEIAYAKVEFGEVATKFVDDDPATKLARCQRYLYVIGSASLMGFIPMFSISEKGFRGILQTPLRAIPTVKLIDNGGYQKLFFSSTNVQVTNLPTVGHKPESLLIRINLDEAIAGYSNAMAGYYEVSGGNILLFSAEL